MREETTDTHIDKHLSWAEASGDVESFGYLICGSYINNRLDGTVHIPGSDNFLISSP